MQAAWHMEKARKDELDAFHRKIDDRAVRQRNYLPGAPKPAPAAARDSDASESAPKRKRAGNAVLRVAKNLRGPRCFEAEAFHTAIAKSIPPNVTRQDLARRTSGPHRESYRA